MWWLTSNERTDLDAESHKTILDMNFKKYEFRRDTQKQWYPMIMYMSSCCDSPGDDPYRHLMCWFVWFHVTIHLTCFTFQCAVHRFCRWWRTCLVAVMNVHTHMVAQLILSSAEMILKKPNHLNALWGKVFHCSWSVEEFIQTLVQCIIFLLSFHIWWLLLKPSVQDWFSVFPLSSL